MHGNKMLEPTWSQDCEHLSYGMLKELVSEVPKSQETIALHGGLPPEECFPIAQIQLKLHNGDVVDVPASMCQQQYNVSAYGYEPLRAWCEAHTKSSHGRPDSHRTMVTDSTTHALEMLTSLLLNPGDSILVEEYTYSHFVECVVDRKGYQVIPVKLDDDGIVPETLERSIEQIRCASSGEEVAGPVISQMPRLLYMIPTGQNPTGSCLPEHRRREIYRICSKYNIFIIEDDPYHYVQYALDSDQQPGAHNLESHSLLPYDVDGRVIRLDSFAKFLAPGFRLGWATASPYIIEKLAMQIQSLTLGANMMSQGIVWSILDKWGDDGLDRYLLKMQELYSSKAKVLLEALDTYMRDIAVWGTPKAGMFLWVKIKCVNNCTMELTKKLRQKGIVVLPGYVLQSNQRDKSPCPYLRISFSYASHELLTKGVKRMSEYLKASKLCIMASS